MEEDSMRWILCASVLAMLVGCRAYTLDVDGRIAERAAHPIDAQLSLPKQAPSALEEPKKRASLGVPLAQPDLVQAGATQPGIVLPVAPKEGPLPVKTTMNMYDRINERTKGLPGGDARPIVLPAVGGSPAERAAAIKKQFPPLPALKSLPEAQLTADGRALTLTDLQQIALRTNPLIRQAHLDVEAARGTALQAGLSPNPNIGYEAAAIGIGDFNGNRSPGQQGVFVEQAIVTMGKLKIAREAALRDAQIAEQKVRQAESDLQTQVRSGYFAVLSARKNFDTNKALVQLTDELYEVLLVQLLVGEVAAYEPKQIAVLAWQARGSLTVAHNRYIAAWRQLAANLGMPTMPLTAVEGQIDMPVPHFDHDQALAYVLINHTDVISAQLGVEKARLLARLAEVQPFPDVTVHVAVQKDYTTPPFATVSNVSVAMPFPLWNRNQGNIQATRAQLRRALVDNHRVADELTVKTAEAFERYANNRELLRLYKDHILPTQVQAFRAAVARHAAVGDKSVSYNDVVTSQQTLASLITSYLAALNDQWTSVVDIANLLQTKDLFQNQQLDEVAPIPDVPEIIRGGLRHRR
jgi:cobalt-zinc-cadmium efflux system outer membrane protein